MINVEHRARIARERESESKCVRKNVIYFKYWHGAYKGEGKRVCRMWHRAHRLYAAARTNRSNRRNIYGWFATSLKDCKKSANNRSHIISGTKC